MKMKTVLVLFVVAGILSAASYFILKKDQDKSLSGMGEKVFADFPINRIAEVVIMDADNRVHLKKGDAIWRVEETYGFPADFPKLADMIRKLGRLKIGRTFQGSEPVLARLKLNDPENKAVPKTETGTQIILKDINGVLLETIILGNTRQAASGSGGQYLKKDGSDLVFLTDQSFMFLKKTPSEWIRTDILDIKEADIKRVACFADGRNTPVYTIERKEKKSTPKLANAPDGKTASASKISQVFEALSPLTITGVSGKINKNAPADHPIRIEYQTFDNTKIFVFPHKTDTAENAYTLFVTVETDPSVDPSDEKGLGEDLSLWEFEVAKWQFESFITTAGDLLE